MYYKEFSSRNNLFQYLINGCISLRVDFQFIEIINIEVVYQIQEFLILYYLRKIYN